ncbi:hypothetical protein LBBP_04525 (plasmid) [Leptospira borgpetersenii serovar Ballum]|uniref:Uncharacterized protein n=1 Tax=Leptospira borgpetersenii serovar Ballum TaxID=280505 RepID=A0A0S2IYM9_LEPBO|nr:hypothetical protein LBBP_00365 [Leptospira borgpetersenii serovar Ballum]ALO28621.1 hypothetical protein LBBP_04525 [Leptospira borgpetersenii serovar Ballum]
MRSYVRISLCLRLVNFATQEKSRSLWGTVSLFRIAQTAI